MKTIILKLTLAAATIAGVFAIQSGASAHDDHGGGTDDFGDSSGMGESYPSYPSCFPSYPTYPVYPSCFPIRSCHYPYSCGW